MPEGPEIVLLQEAAAPFIGQEVVAAEGNTLHVPLNELEGQVLRDVLTHGKELFFLFDGFAIRIHLLLFGKWMRNATLPRQLRLGLQFEGGAIRFYDCDCRLVRVPLDKMFRQKDVLHPAFDTAGAAAQMARKPLHPICDVLLDQHIFPGVGNGIKNEVLYQRQVHPLSLVGEIAPPLLRKLAEACVEQSHAYLDHLRDNCLAAYWQVYRKKQCMRDGMPLRSEKLGRGKRSCYYCEKCQYLYLSDLL